MGMIINCVSFRFRSARSDNILISGDVLITKADELARKLGKDDFKCTSGYIDRFKKRHAIVCKSVCGESAAVDENVTDKYKQETLPNILKNYEPKDIFNADETGLFYKLLPNKTLQFKGEKCHGGKKGKERITVMPTANMDGSEKLKLLVIGKFKNPRCFKGVNSLPVDYQSNKRAWMTSDMFTQWVRGVDKMMTKKKRNILLFVDNCPAHPNVTGLKSVRLVFLPPNTTAVLQPMDQGIIRCLKQLYRRNLISYMLRCYDSKTAPVIDVKCAINFIHMAWCALNQTAIANCYRKAGFVRSVSADESDDDDTPLSGLFVRAVHDCEEDELPLAELRVVWETLSERCQIPKEVTCEEYARVDDETLTTQTETDDDIVDQVLSKRLPELSDNEESESAETDSIAESKCITVHDYLRSIETARNFLHSHDNVDSALFNCCGQLEEFGMQVNCRKSQTKVTDFFK